MAKSSKEAKLLKKYYNVLRYYGKKITGEETINEAREMWDGLRKEIKSLGEKAPTLYEANRIADAVHDFEKTSRDDNMNTPPFESDLDEDKALEILQTFESDVIQIHHDTLEYIDMYSREGYTHTQGKLANIAKKQENMDAINDTYFKLLNKINDLKESGIPVKILAQAIQDNIELDYIISITLMPPSDIQLEFEKTIEQLDAIMYQIEADARERAEREYYGENGM